MYEYSIHVNAGQICKKQVFLFLPLCDVADEKFPQLPFN